MQGTDRPTSAIPESETTEGYGEVVPDPDGSEDLGPSADNHVEALEESAHDPDPDEGHTPTET